MSKSREILIADICKTTGVDRASVIAVVDRLYQMRTLDDLRARQYAAVAKVMDLFVSTDLNERAIHGIVGDELGLTPQGVGYLQRMTLPRT